MEAASLSYREMAEEIQISHSALHKTLTVRDSYPDHNLAKFVHWYLDDKRKHFGTLEGVDRVIQVLDTFDSLLPQERAAAARELGEAYDRIFRKFRAAVPPWVEMLKRARPEDLSGGGPGDPPKKPKGRKKK
jgi:hypothetical protein